MARKDREDQKKIKTGLSGRTEVGQRRFVRKSFRQRSKAFLSTPGENFKLTQRKTGLKTGGKNRV